MTLYRNFEIAGGQLNLYDTKYMTTMINWLNDNIDGSALKPGSSWDTMPRQKPSEIEWVATEYEFDLK